MLAQYGRHQGGISRKEGTKEGYQRKGIKVGYQGGISRKKETKEGYQGRVSRKTALLP
jgi:hypothetical protein